MKTSYAKNSLITILAVCSIVMATMLYTCTDNGHRKENTKKYTFTDEVLLRTTPVKNQGRSPLCWIYAMLATIETDRIMAGDSVNLSPDYPARMWMADRARRCFLSGGEDVVDMRGMAPMLLGLADEYGLMPYDPYNCGGKANYNVLARRTTAVARRSTNMSDLDIRCNDILDQTIGYLPSQIWLYGAEYSPQQFARSLFLPGDYTALTSFTHHPMGESFALELPDNKTGCRFLNVPIDTLMARITSAIKTGHAVCWEGDITEPGFSFARGTAVLTGNKPCTQEQRQKEFETRRTTDDHCMALIGMAHDRHGRRYFIAKNSWGTDNPYGGMMYLAEEYVRMKTIAVVMRTE